jgi:hypothetical protein
MKHFNKSIYHFVLFGIFFFFSSVMAASVEELMAAVIRNSDSAVRAQIESGVNPNLRDEKGRTALTLAIHQQAEKIIPVLLQARKIDINTTNQAGESPLMLAIITGQDSLARQLVLRGAAVNKQGWAPLHYAATKGNLEIMRLLLAKDAYIDTESPNQTTPLMMAAQYSGSVEAVKFLLRQGADPWMKNQIGMTALDFARRGGNSDILHEVEWAQRRRKPEYDARPVAPLSPASAAELQGLPIPEDPEPVEIIYPEGMEPPSPPPALPGASEAVGS